MAVVVYSLSASLWHSTAGLLAAAAGAAVLAGALAARQTTAAWATGAEGEERTARLLAPLADRGYVIFHDRKVPLSTANIDHIVIGATGVFVVETKNIAGDLRLTGGTVRIGGRKVDLVAEVGREVAAVWNAVGDYLEPRGLEVIPVVCAHRANLPWFRRSVAGIRLVSGGSLVGFIEGQPRVLAERDVAGLRGRLSRHLPR